MWTLEAEMTYSSDALSLFRSAIRIIRMAPGHVQSKMIFNTREIFEIYKDVGDETKRMHVLQEGWHDIGVFKEILKAEPSLLTELFRHYETISGKKEETQKEEVNSIGAQRDCQGAVLIPHAELVENEMAEGVQPIPLAN